MKLYIENDPAPNPRRVGIFLREKNITLETVRVDMRARAHKSPEHLARNSLGQLPVLELDDGRMLSESVSICRYLEGLHPNPPLFGATNLDKAWIDMWIRRIELNLMAPVGQFWRHAHRLTAAIIEQHRDFGESNRARTAAAMQWLDGELATHDYIAGPSFSMADIVAITTIDFARLIGLPIPEDCTRLGAWRARMEERPSVPMPEGYDKRFR